jgi:hypothetical protein
MPKKGDINNPRGRPAGSANVVNKEIKERFKEFVDSNFESVQGWLERIAQDNPAKAFELYLALSERILGKVATSSIDITSQGKAIQQPLIHINGNPPADTDNV